MPILNVTDEQIIDLVRQLPPERRRAVLYALTERSADSWGEDMAYAETQLRRIATERGLDWGVMSDGERLDMVDDMIHEDRQCRR
ncbi:MAG: hypothetical protein U0531_16050 [Dehalococcoidia bacterium]